MSDSLSMRGTTDCTCLTPTELAQMQARNEVVQSHHPCPAHGEPDLSGITLIPRIDMSGMEFKPFRTGGHDG